jgi:hypothetical protein
MELSSRQSFVLVLIACLAVHANAFVVSQRGVFVPRAIMTNSQLYIANTKTNPRGKGGFGTTITTTMEEESSSTKREQEKGKVVELATLNTMQVKEMLLDLVPRMMGTPEEFELVQSYVNTLEDRYTPVQTLDFLNLAMSGDWQLLFSTNLTTGPKPNFRLREMFQRVQPAKLEGTITNEATWDLAQDGSSTFDATGTFSVKCSYKINQGARMVVNLEDHVLQPSKGSKIPQDVPALVGLLCRALPKELFDPSEHAMDTTYLDGDLRIVRMTGPRFEGVRDIFMRRGSMEINPTSQQDN